MSLTAVYRKQLIDRLRLSTEDLAWAVSDLSHDDLRWTSGNGEWSIHEQLSHLVDMEERFFLPLLRWAAVPEMLEPADYNRRVWRDERYNDKTPLRTLTRQMERLRDEESEVLAQLDDQAWLKVQEGGSWSPVTCQWIAEVTFRHALDHLQGVLGVRGDLQLSRHLQPPQQAAGAV